MDDLLKFYIYVHFRLDNNYVFYVGKGSRSRAWSKHNRNEYWHNIVSKYGYRVEIIECGLSEEQAFSKEIDLIKSINPVANLTLGGEGGDTFSKLSESNRQQLIEAARTRAQDPNGGVAKAAKLRIGKTKSNDLGLQKMAEHNSFRFSGEGNPMHGKSYWNTKTEKEKLKLKEQISQSLKLSYKLNPRKYKITMCPFCGKSGAQTSMTRYHFNNCKSKNT